jgi:hypothetical protein
MIRLKRYCVTVRGYCGPARTFWTMKGAYRYRYRFTGPAFLYRWREGKWILMDEVEI